MDAESKKADISESLFDLPLIRLSVQKATVTRSCDDIISIRSAILKTAFFRNISDHLTSTQIDYVCKNIRYETFETGQTVFKQGDRGDKFYTILSGECEILVKVNSSSSQTDEDVYEEKSIFICGPGGYFGERALEFDERRAATVVALTFVETLVIEKDLYTSVIKGIGKNVTSTDSSAKAFTFRVLNKKSEYRSQEELETVARYLKKRVIFFKRFDAERQIDLIRVSTLTCVPEKSRFFSQGEIGRAFYVILSGSVEVWVQPPLEEDGNIPPPVHNIHVVLIF